VLPPFLNNYREYGIMVEKYNRALAAAAKRNGVPLIDQFTWFNRLDKKRLFIDGSHFGEEGAQAAADMLFDVLSKDPLIQGKSKGM
jgi:lysophospholipase L1-like esterase